MYIVQATGEDDSPQETAFPVRRPISSTQTSCGPRLQASAIASKRSGGPVMMTSRLVSLCIRICPQSPNRAACRMIQGAKPAAPTRPRIAKCSVVSACGGLGCICQKSYPGFPQSYLPGSPGIASRNSIISRSRTKRPTTAPAMPRNPPQAGGPEPIKHRLVLDGIFWIVRSSSHWRDLLEEFGKWSSTYRQFRRRTRAAGGKRSRMH